MSFERYLILYKYTSRGNSTEVHAFVKPSRVGRKGGGRRWEEARKLAVFCNDMFTCFKKRPLVLKKEDNIFKKSSTAVSEVEGENATLLKVALV